MPNRYCGVCRSPLYMVGTDREGSHDCPQCGPRGGYKTVSAPWWREMTPDQANAAAAELISDAAKAHPLGRIISSKLVR